MNVRFADRRPDGAHALALPVTTPGALDGALAGLAGADILKRAATGERFQAEPASLVEAWAASEGTEVRRVLLAGLGATPDAAALEKTGAALAARLQTSGETTLVIDLSHFSGDRTEAGARLAYGAVLRSWRHDLYRTRLKPKQKPTLTDIVIVGAGDGAAGLWAKLEKVAAGVAFTRGLVTEPANILYPESFVERARALEALGVEITVLDEAAMREAGMGALLGVSQGSAREARLLVMKWDGTGGKADPVALVGKGVTSTPAASRSSRRPAWRT